MKPTSEWMRKRRQELMIKTSDAEKSAFQNLRKLGISAYRQYPVWTGRRMYFADFYLPKYNIIFEIDGGYHYTNHQKKLDDSRSSGLWRLGYHVVRLSNHDARNILKIKNKILLILGRNIKK